MTRRLLFIVNEASFFLSHRREVAFAAQASGYEVHVATRPGSAVADIVAMGCVHHELRLSRSGMNLWTEVRSLIETRLLIAQVKPDLLHLVTIKPVLYGGIVAHLSPSVAIVAAISGLGTVFIAQGFVASLRRSLVLLLYFAALRHDRLVVIFQNYADRDSFLSAGLLSQDKARIIPGSGVDLNQYRPPSKSTQELVVLMASRLLIDKGVREFVAAARMLASRGVSAQFWLAGDIDPGNRASLSTEELDEIRREGSVHLVGHRTDMPELLRASCIVVLPSYREGFPKVLIEAAACGRPVVTTDVPGCRDAIVAGETGVLVPARDATALANAIEKLVTDADMRERFGRAARRRAEEIFSVDEVVSAHLKIYGGLAPTDVGPPGANQRR